MARFPVQLNEANGVMRDGVLDYIPALIVAARDIAELNQYVDMMGVNPQTGESSFPRAIVCNPDAVVWVEATEAIPPHWEGGVTAILGDLNTPPTDDGFVLVDINNYEWINFRFLIQMPTSFFIIGGLPPQCGTFV